MCQEGVLEKAIKSGAFSIKSFYSTLELEGEVSFP